MGLVQVAHGEYVWVRMISMATSNEWDACNEAGTARQWPRLGSGFAAGVCPQNLPVGNVLSGEKVTIVICTIQPTSRITLVDTYVRSRAW